MMMTGPIILQVCIDMYWTYYIHVGSNTNQPHPSDMYMSCTCTLVPQIFLVRQKFSWRFSCNHDDNGWMGVETSLDNVPICRLRAGGCTTYMYVYVYVPICIVCVTML